jgi:integrase
VLRQTLARGESIGELDEAKQRSQPFRQFAKKWFAQYVVANNKYSEQCEKSKILATSLVPFFGGMALDAIKAYHIEQYKARQAASGVSNKTINNRLAVLGKCLRCAHEWHGVEKPGIKMLRCALPKTDYLTVAECELLLSCSDGQLREMLLLALRTGMRQGEIRGLQWSSIDWQNRTIAVRHSPCTRKKALVAPKSNRERHIPLDTEVYESLFRRKRHAGYVFINQISRAPFTTQRLMEDLSILCGKAHMRKIGWHVLRHTFATQLTFRGVPLPVVKELLGHSSVTTTMRYSHVAPSALRSAIQILDPKGSGMDFGQPVGNQWQRLLDAEAHRVREQPNRP